MPYCHKLKEVKGDYVERTLRGSFPQPVINQHMGDESVLATLCCVLDWTITSDQHNGVKQVVLAPINQSIEASGC